MSLVAGAACSRCDREEEGSFLENVTVGEDSVRPERFASVDGCRNPELQGSRTRALRASCPFPPLKVCCWDGMKQKFDRSRWYHRLTWRQTIGERSLTFFSAGAKPTLPSVSKGFRRELGRVRYRLYDRSYYRSGCS